MQKIDPVVLKETKYIAVWGLVLSAVMQAVFLILNLWDYTVLLGNLLSYGAVVLNYFGIGITVQKAVEKDEKDAKQTMKLSNTVRMLFLFVVVVIGVVVECFHMWAVLIPLLFPRIAIALRMLQTKKTEGEDQAHEE